MEGKITSVKSQRIVCCGAKHWVSFIGWLQIVCSGISIAFFSIFLIWLAVAIYQNHDHVQGQLNKNPDRKEELERELIYAFVSIFIGLSLIIVAFLFGFIGGIFLIMGVKQKNARKLTWWLILEVIYMIFLIVGIILETVGGATAGVLSVIFDVLTVVIPIFFMWVVNVHRKELIGVSAGLVNAGFES